MLPYFAKRIYYLAAAPLMRLNGLRHRYLFSSTLSGGSLKVHLGPGQRSYLDGWANIDANMFTGKCDIWYDFRYSLPINDGTADAVYSHHVIEHIPNIGEHVSDIARILKPGGVCRIGGPHGDNAIDRFLQNDSAWFTNYPDNRRSPGGRLDNFIFCRREHVSLLTISYMRELIEDAGLEFVGVCMPTRTTNYPELFSENVLQSEFESDFQRPHTIIVEAMKPTSA